MGKQTVIICDSCGAMVEVGKYYLAEVTGGKDVGIRLNRRRFYFCQECVRNGSIGNAIKNMKGEQA